MQRRMMDNPAESGNHMIVEDAGRRKWGEQMPRGCDVDREKIKQLTEAILKSAGGLSRFKKALPPLLRATLVNAVANQ